MKLKRIIRQKMLMVALAAIATSCTNSYPGLYYDKSNGNSEQQYATAINVSLSPQNIFSLVATRGTGSFETSSFAKKCINGVFYIYAFRSGKDLQGQFTSDADLTQTMGTDSAHADCLVDDNNAYHGKPAKMVADSTGALYFVNDAHTNKQSLYYSSSYSQIPYDFFGYYIDDFAPTASNYHRTNNEIYYDLTVDGAQDVLVGYAPKLTTNIFNARYGNLDLSEDTKNQIINIGGYSTYAGKYDVQPVIDVKHALTKIKFAAIAADSTADDVLIRDLSLTGKNSGKLVVAARDLSNVGFIPDGKTSTLYLREASLDGSTPGTLISKEGGYQVLWNDSLKNIPLASRPSTPIGESIMLASDSTYTMALDYDMISRTKQADGTIKEKVEQKVHTTYNIKAPTDNAVSYDSASGTYIFKPGYEYTIKIAVYGLQQVKISVSSEAWESGGSINIDVGNDAKKNNL